MADLWDQFPDAAPAADPWGKFPDAPAPTIAPLVDLPALGVAANRELAQTPGVIAGTADAALGALTAATSKPEVEQPKGTWAGAGAQLLHGAREGAMNTLGLLPDAANNAPRLLNLLPGVSGVGPIATHPVMGGDFLNAIMDKISGGPMAAPIGPVERTASRVGQEVGAAAVPVGGMIAAGGRVGVQAARDGGVLSRMFLEPAAVDPAKFAAKEATAAVAAGSGASLANEGARAVGVEPGAKTDIAGAFGGLGALGLSSMLIKGLGQVGRAIFQPAGYTDQVVRDDVTGRLASALGATPNKQGVVDTTSLVDAIKGGQRIDDAVPGFKESLSDRTGNPRVAGLEYGRQAVDETGQFAQRRAENTNAIDEALNRSAPAPDASPGALRSELETERNRRLTDAGAQTLNHQDLVEAALRPVTPQGTPATRGNTVRTALEDARDAARGQTEEAYRASNTNGNIVDPAPLTEGLDQTIAGMTQAERSLIPEGLVNRVRALGAQTGEATNTGILDASGNPITRPAPPPEPVSLKEATDLRVELARLQRAALGDPKAEKGGRNAARVINQLLETTDGFIARNVTPEQQAALDTARTTKFNEAEAFTRQGDPVAAVLARNEGGMPKVRDDRVAGTFVNPQSMDRLFTQVDTPQVRTAIRDEVLSRGDTSSAQRIRDFTTTYGEQMDRFPGLRQEMEAAATAREAHAGAQQTEQTLTRELGTESTPGRSTVGQYLRYGDENAEKAMRGVMGAAKPAEATDELLRFVNDAPEAVAGARKAFWNIMQKDARAAGATTKTMDGAQPWNPTRLKSFLDDPRNAAVAERLYRDNPEHLDNIRKVSEAIQGVDLRNSAKAPNASGTAQGNRAVLTPESLQSRYYAYARGQVGLGYLATSLASTLARNSIRKAQTGAMSKMLDEALLNPDVAATLLKENNPANRAALAKKAKGWSANELSTLLRSDDSSDQTDAIMRK